jgi:hypothetical protein
MQRAQQSVRSRFHRRMAAQQPGAPAREAPSLRPPLEPGLEFCDLSTREIQARLANSVTASALLLRRFCAASLCIGACALRALRRCAWRDAQEAFLRAAAARLAEGDSVGAAPSDAAAGSGGAQGGGAYGASPRAAGAGVGSTPPVAGQRAPPPTPPVVAAQTPPT